MRLKNSKFMYMIALMAAVLCFGGLSGCSSEKSPQMTNENYFSLDNISDITISYDEENITFFESDSNELIVQEYMTADRSSYYAKADQRDNSIKISEGGKPFFKSGFLRYVEVYLPASYEGNLTVTTTDGDIDLSDVELQLSSLRIDSTGGKVELNSAEAKAVHLSSTEGTLEVGGLKGDQIRLETTSGSTVCEKLEGEVTYTSVSGDAKITSAVGCGSYTVDNSGLLDVTYLEVTGDLYLFNKNDDVHITIPEKLEFEFRAETKNGSVSTNFQEFVTIDGRTTKGMVGSQPTVSVEVETKNGNVEAIQYSAQDPRD